MANDVLIEGIDGATPLGFLAGLGLLQVLQDARVQVDESPRLCWKMLDSWRPVLHGADSLESVAQVVLDDGTHWAESAVLGFNYVKQEKQGPKRVGGLKAPLSVVRGWSRTRREVQDEVALAYGAALFCDEVTETNKSPATSEAFQLAGVATDPTVSLDLSVDRSFFDFTSRNAQFLEQVEVLRQYLNLERILQALGQGKPDYDAPRTLDWDPSSDTPGAIYTGFRRGYLPVHEWLGFRGLRLFPLAGHRNKVRMTACTGRRLNGDFTWPLWEAPAASDAVRSLLGNPGLAQLRPEQRRAFGVSVLMRASLTKKADGYTGTFAPPQSI
jgi:hypothetical protein